MKYDLVLWAVLAIFGIYGAFSFSAFFFGFFTVGLFFIFYSFWTRRKSTSSPSLRNTVFQKCPNCGMSLEMDVSFCPQCGENVRKE